MTSIFPTPTYIGQTYTIGSTTYVWTGVAWIKQTSASNVTFNVITATQITITTTTNSTSTTTGALIVAGGAAIGGDLVIGGNVAIEGSIIGFGGNLIAERGSNVTVLDTGTIHQITIDINYAPLALFNETTATFYKSIDILSTETSTSTTTGALTVSGGVGIRGDLYVAGNVNAPNLRLVDAMFTSNQINLYSGAVAVLDSYDTTQFRSAKYLVQIESYPVGTTATYQVTELLLLVDNEAKVHLTEYASVYSYDQNIYGELGIFSADVQLDNILRFYFTPAENTYKEISVIRTSLVV